MASRLKKVMLTGLMALVLLNPARAVASEFTEKMKAAASNFAEKAKATASQTVKFLKNNSKFSASYSHDSCSPLDNYCSERNALAHDNFSGWKDVQSPKGASSLGIEGSLNLLEFGMHDDFSLNASAGYDHTIFPMKLEYTQSASHDLMGKYTESCSEAISLSRPYIGVGIEKKLGRITVGGKLKLESLNINGKGSQANSWTDMDTSFAADYSINGSGYGISAEVGAKYPISGKASAGISLGTRAGKLTASYKGTKSINESGSVYDSLYDAARDFSLNSTYIGGKIEFKF